MARQGKAARALGLAVIVPMVGSLFGIAVLVSLAEPIAEAALRLSGPEYATIAALGLTMAVGIPGRDLAKGLVSAAGGPFLGMVGLDPTLGIPSLHAGPEVRRGRDARRGLAGCGCGRRLVSYHEAKRTSKHLDCPATDPKRGSSRPRGPTARSWVGL